MLLGRFIRRLWPPPRFILTISDILATFGAFMVVLAMSVGYWLVHQFTPPDATSSRGL